MNIYVRPRSIPRVDREAGDKLVADGENDSGGHEVLLRLGGRYTVSNGNRSSTGFYSDLFWLSQNARYSIDYSAEVWMERAGEERPAPG